MRDYKELGISVALKEATNNIRNKTPMKPNMEQNARDTQNTSIKPKARNLGTPRFFNIGKHNK